MFLLPTANIIHTYIHKCLSKKNAYCDNIVNADTRGCNRNSCLCRLPRHIDVSGFHTRQRRHVDEGDIPYFMRIRLLLYVYHPLFRYIYIKFIRKASICDTLSYCSGLGCLTVYKKKVIWKMLCNANVFHEVLRVEGGFNGYFAAQSRVDTHINIKKRQ